MQLLNSAFFACLKREAAEKCSFHSPYHLLLLPHSPSAADKLFLCLNRQVREKLAQITLLQKKTMTRSVQQGVLSLPLFSLSFVLVFSLVKKWKRKQKGKLNT